MDILKKIRQIGIVVSDIDSAIESWKASGAENFNSFYLSSSRNTCGTVFKDGNPTEIEAKVANTELMNGMQIELIQPLDDKSVYSDFIRENGPGLHHICPDLGGVSFEDASAYMRERYGAPVFSGTGVVMRFEYYDCRKDLGTFVEIAAKK